MPQSETDIEILYGLSEEEAVKRLARFGKNIFQHKKPSRLLLILGEFFQEPMFVLLIAACALYFILGQTDEGWMMLVVMLLVAAISEYQEAKAPKLSRH